MTDIVDADERRSSWCVTCSKRLAYLGPAQERPCPDGETDANVCRQVLEALVMSRGLCQQMKKEPHAETCALLNRSGHTWADIDAEIMRRAAIDNDRIFFTYKMHDKDPIAAWVGGNRDRAMIVAKWALDMIDLTGGGTCSMAEIYVAAEKNAREIKEHAEDMANADWEVEE